MKIRIEIEDKGLKSIHEFESQAMDGEILRERIMIKETTDTAAIKYQPAEKLPVISRRRPSICGPK